MGLPEIATFRSDEAKARYLATYDALRDELLPADRVERTIETDIGSTFVVSYPATGAAAEAVPLLLLPGTMATTCMWAAYLDDVVGTRPIHTLDTVGDAGRSVQRAPARDAADFARWLDQVLDGLGVERVHLGGISQGGWLALVLAVRSPGRVASMTLSEPGGLSRINLPKFFIRSFAMMAAYFLPGFLGRGLAALLHTGIRNQHRGQMKFTLQAMRSFRTSIAAPQLFTDDELRSIMQPTYLQLASSSEVIDAEPVRARVEATMPNVRVDVVAKASHSVGTDRPETMIANLLALDDASIAT
jgi:pimeloyl-ACP methyl ester carboxylesterase